MDFVYLGRKKWANAVVLPVIFSRRCFNFSQFILSKLRPEFSSFYLVYFDHFLMEGEGGGVRGRGKW